jgi:hypothetical protein
MATAKKPYARYYIVRELQTMWRGEAADPGAKFRQVAITSNEFNSTLGIFQVFALEGASAGIKDGKFTTSDEEPEVLFDKDFDGLDSAAERFELLVSEAQKAGFHPTTTMEILEFEDKVRRSQQSH